MQNSKNIRVAEKADHPAILAVWLASVTATHHFLAPHHLDPIAVQLREQWLDLVDTLIVWEEAGRIRGFIGVNLPRVEMLFVAPDAMGKGIGRALLDTVREKAPQLEVDVNEQNAAAHNFYRRYGFVETGRSPVDAQGLPYPLIHLRLPG